MTPGRRWRWIPAVGILVSALLAGCRPSAPDLDRRPLIYDQDGTIIRSDGRTTVIVNPYRGQTLGTTANMVRMQTNRVVDALRRQGRKASFTEAPATIADRPGVAFRFRASNPDMESLEVLVPDGATTWSLTVIAEGRLDDRAVAAWMQTWRPPPQ